MAKIQQHFTEFNGIIRLSNDKKEKLQKSRKSIRSKINKYFSEKKSNELQPKYEGQGSFEMNTVINPIPVNDKDGNTILKYDLDDGVYFIEKDREDNKKSIDTWHSWVFNAVDDHTNSPTKDKTTCVRVVFADGHHIDLPIYYEKDNKTELAHKSKGWIESKPVEFTNWFNEKAKDNQQLRRIVRYLKAWKNFREFQNSNLNFPSGFALTILAVNSFKPDTNDDKAFLETIEGINDTLNYHFQCLRPTTPKNEDIFIDFSETRKKDFLNALDNLLKDCKKAKSEKNIKKATEYLIKHFGDRFPLGKDKDEETSNNALFSALSSTAIKPKPYSNGQY